MFKVTDSVLEGGWSSQPQQQHFSSGQGAAGSAQVDGDPQSQVAAALQADAQGGGAPSGNGQGQSSGGQAQPQGQQGNEFLDGILAQIDPAHRPIVQPYLTQWNAGVTRRFQELHGELNPYKELGADPETMSMALSLMERIDTDPQGVLELLQEAVAEMTGQQPGQGVPGQQPPQGLGTPPAPGGETPSAIPPELEQRLGTFESVLEAIAQQMLDGRQSEAQQAEDGELDNYLGLLKTELGDFDEDYVLAKMYAGVDGEEAVKQYQQAIQGQVNQRSRTPNVPPILGGGGAVPQGNGKGITDASKSETKNLVAQILAASQA